MSTIAESRAAEADRLAYEDEQVRRIAAWKSEPPHPIGEMFKRLTMPGARLVEHLIPDALVRSAIERAYDVSAVLAGRKDVERWAGVDDIEVLRHAPLEQCDRLASRVSVGAEALTVAEGAATGAGGPFTTLLDVPLIFVLAIRSIIKIGHCYGYRLDRPVERRFVLAVLLTATSDSLQTRRERLARLRDVEDWLIEEVQEDIVSEEVSSFLFQLEIFEDVPGVGVVSGALLNLAFMRKVDLTARRVFQERWLRDNGKVAVIAPAETHRRALATGWGGALTRVAHAGGYYVGFGAALPVCLLASLLRRSDAPPSLGVVDGAAAASDDVDRLLAWARGATATPATAPA